MNYRIKNKQVIIIFVFAVIVYGIIASVFTSTVHIGVDEELYIALAKSFHYKGRFEVNGSVVNYNCVLYSMLISLAYYFYSPERILFLMRFIGIIAMCSAVFPIYLLAKNVFEDMRKAIAFSGMTMFLPCMFDGMYLMQEALSYPLFLWTAYFLYRAFEKLNTEGRMWLAVSAIFSVLCFFTKTYLFFIPVTVNCCLLLWFFTKNDQKQKYILGKLLLYDIIYLLGTISLYFMIRKINGGIEGTNHYAIQLSVLFPISIWTFVSGAICCIVYFSLLFLNTGVLPLSALIFNGYKLEGRYKRFRDFYLVACILLVVEIVFLIVLTEEGVPTLPHKFLFRYFQVLVPPLLIIFLKMLDEQEFLKNKTMWLLSGGCFVVCLYYFGYMQGDTRQAIMDGYFYLTLENAAKYVLPYVDVVAVALAGVATVLTIRVVCKGKSGVIKKMFKLGIVGVILFWLLNCGQLYVYTNIIADGKTIQSDSIKIAQYLNGNDCELYYLAGSKEDETSYLRNFYGYVQQTYQIIGFEELGQIAGRGEGQERAFVITPSQNELVTEGIERIDLETERLYLYLLSTS